MAVVLCRSSLNVVERDSTTIAQRCRVRYMAGTTRDVKRARTAQRILDAARTEFAARGFDGATIRGIAGAAGVDASLVMQHFGSKGALFNAAVQLPANDGNSAAEHLLDVLTVRLGELPPETTALVQSMLTVPEAGAAM